MLRDTMMRTIPVAMMAMDVLWTERFHRFRAVRKAPSDRMWKAIQMAIRAITMPKSRVSISVDVNIPRHDRPGCGVVLVTADASFGVSTVVIRSPCARTSGDACPRPNRRGHAYHSRHSAMVSCRRAPTRR